MDQTVWWEVIQSWLANHGWTILITLIVAYVVHRFGKMFISRAIHHGIDSSSRFETKRDRDLRAQTLVGLFSSILRIGVWVVTAFIIFSELNLLIYLAPFIAGAGVLSLLLSFGIQTFVKDFISGIFIVAENQYRVGDVVTATTLVGGSVEGTVTRITMRTTVLRDNDGAIHFIPNGNIARAANQTLDYSKINIELNLPLSIDFTTAERSINQLGRVMSQEEAWQRSIIQAPYYHGVQSLDGEQVIIEIRAKTTPTDQWRVSSELRQRLAKLLDKESSFSKKTEAKKSSK